jgi:hypothetical protein
MKRVRWIGIGVLAVACVLAGSPARAGVQPAAHRAQGTAKIVALSADAQVTRTVIGANGVARTSSEVTHLYRDGQGRVRQDTGPLVTVNDPTTGSIVRWNTQSRTYQRVPAARPGGGPAAQPSGPQPVFSPRHDLGTASVSGVSAQGQAYTVTVPRGAAKAVTKQVTVWASAQAQLPVRTQVTESTGQSFSQTYTNIRAGEPDGSLFAVPAGYRQGDTTVSRSLAEACFLFNAPDPLILFDFGAGAVEAVTDQNASCIFVAHAWGFVPPLFIFPFTNPGSWYDAFGAFDDGGPVPFFPFVAPGDITFFAANQTDLTIKDSLVILTVFGF